MFLCSRSTGGGQGGYAGISVTCSQPESVYVHSTQHTTQRLTPLSSLSPHHPKDTPLNTAITPSTNPLTHPPSPITLHHSYNPSLSHHPAPLTQPLPLPSPCIPHPPSLPQSSHTTHTLPLPSPCTTHTLPPSPISLHHSHTPSLSHHPAPLTLLLLLWRSFLFMVDMIR